MGKDLPDWAGGGNAWRYFQKLWTAGVAEKASCGCKNQKPAAFDEAA
jgi:hypothetical protein